MENRGPQPLARVVIVVPAAAMLLLGLVAGLVLLGLPLPTALARLADLHAPLMVFGFVGTLIALERAVALRAWWALLAPVLMLVGTALTLTRLPVAVGTWSVAAGLGVHCLQYVAIWRRQPMTATAVQALGAVTAVVAAVLWSGGVDPAALVPALAVYLVLTIAGERWELARIAAPPPRAEAALAGLAVCLAAVAVLAVPFPAVCVPLAGLLLLGLVAVLLRYDVARTTVTQSGLARYVAVCLLCGYAWLAVAGFGWLLGGPQTTGRLFDATTHAVFLGFVMTMIMAHAPIILPAVLRVRIPYHAAMYAPLALLQAGLLVRALAGDAWDMPVAVQVGGIAGEAALVAFGITVVTLSHRARAARSRAASSPSRTKERTHVAS